MSLPGRRITTNERRIGVTNKEIAWGYAVAPLDVTFIDTTILAMRQYVEHWMSLAGNFDSRGGQEINVIPYPNQYKFPVEISQLASTVPLVPARFPIFGVSIASYSLRLHEAFVTSISNIDYSNDLDGYVEFTVTLSYSWWERIPAGQLQFNINF